MNQPLFLVPRRSQVAVLVVLALMLSAFGLVAGIARASAQAGTDVVVNNSATDVPEQTTQSETSLAVRGNTICAGFNDSGPNAGLSGFARSANLGGAWTDQGELGANNSGDPALDVDRTTGTFYYAENATIGGNTAIGVARSTDDCRTFGAAVNASAVASGLAGTTLMDKPSIAVDNTASANNGNLYVCFTRFFNPNSELRFSRSTDGGATFVNEQILQVNGTAPFGCHVEVGPAGQVYVVWADRIGATAGDIRFRSSTDGGLTFGAAVSVSTGNRLPGVDRVVSCGPNNNRTTLNGDIRMLHQAWMAVDTTGGLSNGNLYVVWASDPVGATDNSDVFFSRSTNGGVTWSAATQVGAGGGLTDQFEPNIAVAGAGTVSIAWYDRRRDQANNLLIDVFKTFSRDGGATLDPIVRVTDVNFGLPPLNPNFDNAITNCYVGEYIAVEGDAQNFYYLWGDNRNTVVSAAFPNGRPDPDVFFEYELAPGANLPPVCTGVSPDPALLWPPNHKFRGVTLSGATDPNGDPVTLVASGVTQDEPVNGQDDGNTTPDARLTAAGDRVLVRAERSGLGDGRVYRIAFTVTDPLGASCSGVVTVGVPHDMGAHPIPVDSAPPSYNSLVP